MLEYQKKKQVRRFMYSKVTLVLLFIMMILLAKGVWGLYIKSQESQKNKLAAQAEYDKLVAREALVSSQIVELKTSEGVEKEIRSKFNVAKEGEQVVVIVDKEKKNEGETQQKKGFWATIKKIFTE